MQRIAKRGTAMAAAAMALCLGTAASAEDISACLIVKTDTNPFFVKMKEGAQAKADELGIDLMMLAGREEGDNEGQVMAMESCIASGVDGILLAPTDSGAIVDTVKMARDNGILVIAIDTPLDPTEAADATFATDNFEAGRLIGAWAKAQLGEAAADAKIAYLDLLPSQPRQDVARDQGFMTGFGIDVGDITRIGDETDPRNVCHDTTNGNPEGGREAMENCLQVDPGINVVYTINEPSAAGAYEALRAVGREEDVMIVSVDGGCPGVTNVAEGVIGATAQQYPQLMATLGIEAIKTFAETGEKPGTTEGLDFFDTGAVLVTDEPVEGLELDGHRGGTGEVLGLNA